MNKTYNCKELQNLRVERNLKEHLVKTKRFENLGISCQTSNYNDSESNLLLNRYNQSSQSIMSVYEC